LTFIKFFYGYNADLAASWLNFNYC